MDKNLISIQISDQLPLWSAPFALDILEYVDYSYDKNVLDIGCGTGFLSIELAQRLGIKSHVYALDIEKTAIKKLNDKIRMFGINNIESVAIDFYQYTIENNFFDLIVSCNGFNNLSDIDKAFSKCYKMLKPHGHLLISQNLPQTMMDFYKALENVLDERGLSDSIEKLHEHIYIKRKSIDYLLTSLKDNGFIINTVNESSFNYKFRDYKAMFGYHEIKYNFYDAWRNILPQGQAELLLDEAGKRLNEKSINNGGIELNIPYCFIECIKE
ncbi:MAG: class I SAM-dependent methyltransferase [Lachnospiraceae bacterium]|nr:class I SAM-dependent methyltransferase [Lachnospiraceae bacterium]